MRILIAEDDFTSMASLSVMIKKMRHEVLETVNGLEALEELQKPNAPKLAIIDWIMPEKNGLEVLRQIRTWKTDQPTYIIMLTMRSEKKDVIVALNSGANDYIVKPFDIGELCARIEVGCRMLNMQDALLESKNIFLHQATHDSLIGLLNRRAILDKLSENVSIANRGIIDLAVGICDIDNFKLINDTYGHHIGDDVICEISQKLTKNKRIYDAVGRMGGEEFFIINPIKLGMNYMRGFERLCDSIAKNKTTTRLGDLVVRVSIGVAHYTPKCRIGQLLATADNALYQAKDQG